MAVYTDGVHLVADTVDELHQFAKSINLNRCWFMNHKKHPHYDLYISKERRKIAFADALSKGAVEKTDRELVNICKRNYG